MGQVPVAGADQVMEVLASGTKNRAVTHTAMNAESSRSHSLLIVTVTTTNKTTGRALSAALTLVDLAGSERISKSEVTGQARKEVHAPELPQLQLQLLQL